MCLGVPGKVVAVEGMVATVDFWGLRKQVRLDVVDAPVSPGDYVLNHVGFAIRRIPAGEAEETLALYSELLARETPGDLMAADVRGELDAAERSGR
ncbi:MAG TPA: HypC/HybG/HupF family hydrogenase formation chaperone [Myxococcaceae bacterium]|nr:HypC/HybG/HupF family hydrogenase formation chaperone [Myxococcaceae bacterium]